MKHNDDLLRAQKRHQITVPVWCEQELMGLVDAWASGVEWNTLISNTSLDEGDVVRIMRRTVDLLAQIPYCELISDQLRNRALFQNFLDPLYLLSSASSFKDIVPE